jgi:hypothetical protein
MMPYPYAEVKTLYVYGHLCAAEIEPGRARQYWLRALGISAQLGERRYAERIEQAMAAVGTEPYQNLLQF